ELMTEQNFHRRFRMLIAANWAIPPFFGLAFLVFVVDMFDVHELGHMLLAWPLPVYVVASQVLADVYFVRYVRPLRAFLAAPNSTHEAAAQDCARRFPLHFWASFVVYLLLAPPA